MPSSTSVPPSSSDAVLPVPISSSSSSSPHPHITPTRSLRGSHTTTLTKPASSSSGMDFGYGDGGDDNNGGDNSIYSEMVESPNGTAYTRDQLSALSGRMIVPGIPPKDQKEAQRHVELIRKHQLQERKLMEKEVKEQKKRRAEQEKREKEWAAILPDFSKYEGSSKMRKLWSKGGLPPKVRGEVWKQALGNPNDVSPLMYKMCIAKSRAAENAQQQQQPSLSSSTHHPANTGAPQSSSSSPSGYHHHARTASNNLGIRGASPSTTTSLAAPIDNLYDNQSLSSPTFRQGVPSTSERTTTTTNTGDAFGLTTSSKPPAGEDLKASFSLGDADATAMLDTIATHFHSSPGSNNTMNSGSAAASGGGGCGNGSVSPSCIKGDSAKAIAVDLHRTIILRSSLTSDPLGVAAAAAAASSAGGASSPNSSSGAHLVMSAVSNLGSSPVTPTAASSDPQLGTSATGTDEPNSPLTFNNVARRFDGCVEGDEGGADYSYGGDGTSSSPFRPNAVTSTTTSSSNTTLHVSNLCDDAALLQRISRLLKAFVELRPDIGYVQGMSYLAAMILLHIPNEHDSFIAMVSLLGRGHLRYFYAVHHQGMSNYIATFEDVLSVGLPELYRHFTVIGVNSQLYVIDWWMSLFSRTLPYEIASRCWDLFLLDEAYLYRVSMCLLLYFKAILHDDSPMDEILIFFSRIQQYSINEHRFFELVADDTKYPPSIDSIKKIMKKRAGDLPPL